MTEKWSELCYDFIKFLGNMSKSVIGILKKVGAITENSHIVLTTGRHTDKYLNLDRLMPFTRDFSYMGKLIAQQYVNKSIDVIAGPAVGGILLAQWVAYHLTRLKKKEIYAVFAEKNSAKQQQIERGFERIVTGKKVLIVEDFTTTGGSVKQVITALKKVGADVVGVCVMLNREPDKVNSKSMGVPFKSLDLYLVESWTESQCPLCKKGLPVNTELGHGKEFLEKQKRKV